MRRAGLRYENFLDFNVVEDFYEYLGMYKVSQVLCDRVASRAVYGAEPRVPCEKGQLCET